MIEGKVGGEQRALVTLEISDSRGRFQPVEAILDTGFTGYLTLPQESIRQLGLRPVGRRTFELANGDFFDFQVYLGSVTWHGDPNDVLVLESDSAPLLGMTLLWGSRVALDAVTDGDVVIEELAPRESTDD